MAEPITVGRLIEILQREDPEAIVLPIAFRDTPAPLMLVDRGYYDPEGRRSVPEDMPGNEVGPGWQKCVRLWPVA